MRKLFYAIFLLALFAATSRAQTFQFSQPTYLTAPTNTTQVTGGPLASNIFFVSLPPISMSFSGATNPNTTVTNTISQVISFTNTVTFVYNAGINGTNFTTNFNNGNPLSFAVTNKTEGWAFPQSGGSNTCYVK